MSNQIESQSNSSITVGGTINTENLSSPKEKELEIALIGNPNTGKTTIYNALCGTRQRVGNFPGVTVEKKMGTTQIGDREVSVIDLPGLYSLKAVSPDEDVAADVIMGRVPGMMIPDVLLFILDATNIKRNLYLFSQVAELEKPLIVVLTMTDLLERENIDLDVGALRRELGVPVIPVVGRNREQIDNLKNTIMEVVESEERSGIDLNFSADLERIADELKNNLNEFVSIGHFEARELLFSEKYTLLDHFRTIPAAMKALKLARDQINGRWAPSILAFNRYSWADRVVQLTEIRREKRNKSLSEMLDSFLTHRVFGLFSFVAIMYIVFQAIYTWAGPFMDQIDAIFGFLGSLAGGYLEGMPVLQSLIVDGVITGVGSVVIFVPQIAILFLFVAFLEDSGYLSRAAFLMDKLLGWTGLNGRAFIPMLSGFACAIPGIMSTRIMPDPRARLTTILIVPLMSCSARLPVYMLFIGAFIEPQFGPGWAAFSLFAMHALGILISLPIAWVLNRGILKTPSIPFVLEMPTYRMPQIYNVVFRAYEASRDFLVRAGTVIFAMSILIWFLSYFPRNEATEAKIVAQYDNRIQLVESRIKEAGENEAAKLNIELNRLNSEMATKISATYLERSYLGRAGRYIQPLFQPLGFDWRLSVGILSAFPAREVIVSTLGIIFNVGEEASEESETLKNKLRNARNADGKILYSALTAVTLMVFFALSSQCMSTLAMVKRELNSWSWVAGLFVYMTVLAYIVAFLVRQIGLLIGFA